VPANSGHHHQPPRARKVFGKSGGPLPAGTPRHDYEPRRGGASCSCGRWAKVGTETTTRIEHRQHVAEVRRQAKERAAKLAAMTKRERLQFLRQERRQRWK
jgi:hypothetical protein